MVEVAEGALEEDVTVVFVHGTVELRLRPVTSVRSAHYFSAGNHDGI